MNFPEFPFDLPFTISADGVVSAVFALVTIFAAAISFILVWHWRRYGLKSPVVLVAEIIYLVGVVLLLASAFINLNL